MRREAPDEVIELAIQNIMDAVESVDQLPTDDASAFVDSFYGIEGLNLGSDMATLIETYGEPVKAKGKEAVLFPDREKIQIRTRLAHKKYRFLATATTWGDDPDDRYREASLQVSTKTVPLITRQRDAWGIKMRAHNADESLDGNPSYRPPLHIFDEAFYVHYQMWKKPVGLRSMPGVITGFPQDRYGIDWNFKRVNSQDETEVVIKHTPDGIPILPSTETNRQLQLFVNNFFDLNLLLLSSTGIPIAVEFVNEHQQSPVTLRSVEIDPDQ